jgi:hypothetical protein
LLKFKFENSAPKKFSVEREFCPERDNLKIARSFNCGIQTQKFPSPAGATEKRAKIKKIFFRPVGTRIFWFAFPPLKRRAILIRRSATKNSVERIILKLNKRNLFTAAVFDLKKR